MKKGGRDRRRKNKQTTMTMSREREDEQEKQQQQQQHKQAHTMITTRREKKTPKPVRPPETRGRRPEHTNNRLNRKRKGKNDTKRELRYGALLLWN
jgi:hypothetical protein